MVPILILSIALLGIGYVAWQQYQTRQRCQTALENYKAKYTPLINADAELEKIKTFIAAARNSHDAFERDVQQKRAKLEKELGEETTKRDGLAKEISSLEEHLEDLSFGFYKPHFTFQTSEEYKEALEKIRENQRQMIHDRIAATCNVKWTVGDSARDGERMTKQYTKLLLRAFNGECDAAVANVSWNNADKMTERVRKSFEALNDLGGVMKMSISPEYLKHKLDELQLMYEYEEKKHQEHEEQKRAKAQLREEEKAQREIDRAKEEAEKEESTYEKLLARARVEAQAATGAQLEKLTAQIESFESKLDEARKKKDRAVARAQLTKSGFVYVISNIGSFGEQIFKIGMTRRMEPMDRIDELGDASVPFDFDVHVMMFSDNAPELELALHRLFESRRMNLVNARKEFYHSLQLEEIETFVKTRGLSAQFIKVPEAREYRQTLALRGQTETARKAPMSEGGKQMFKTAGAN